MVATPERRGEVAGLGCGVLLEGVVGLDPLLRLRPRNARVFQGDDPAVSRPCRREDARYLPCLVRATGGQEKLHGSRPGEEPARIRASSPLVEWPGSSGTITTVPPRARTVLAPATSSSV